MMISIDSLCIAVLAMFITLPMITAIVIVAIDHKLIRLLTAENNELHDKLTETKLVLQEALELCNHEKELNDLLIAKSIDENFKTKSWFDDNAIDVVFSDAEKLQQVACVNC